MCLVLYTELMTVRKEIDWACMPRCHGHGGRIIYQSIVTACSYSGGDDFDWLAYWCALYSSALSMISIALFTTSTYFQIISAFQIRKQSSRAIAHPAVKRLNLLLALLSLESDRNSVSVSATAVTEYSVSAHFRLRPKPEKVVSVGPYFRFL